MYPNLKAELARHNISIADLAIQTGIKSSTLYDKLSGRTPLKLFEAKLIKDALRVNMSIDELFGGEE